MTDFSQRSRDAELMDGEDVSQEEFTACMKDLAQVNTLTMARRPTLDFIRRAIAARPSREPLTILDVGFGAGDALRALRHLCRKAGQPVRLIGIDINPRSAPVARQLTPGGMDIEIRTGDAFDWPQNVPLDIVISSLVTHHMHDEEIVRFLRWMEGNARLGWLVNDLHRHWLPYHGFGLLARAMRWHPFVKHDGPLSIARSFRRADWQALLDQSDAPTAARIAWWFPFRYCVERRKW